MRVFLTQPVCVIIGLNKEKNLLGPLPLCFSNLHMYIGSKWSGGLCQAASERKAEATGRAPTWERWVLEKLRVTARWVYQITALRPMAKGLFYLGVGLTSALFCKEHCKLDQVATLIFYLPTGNCRAEGVKSI